MNEVAETTPTNEADTMKLIEGFTTVFNRARDSIIDASRLAKEVQEVRQELEGIRREMEELRRQNTELDQQLAHVRQQRDEALSEAGSWRRQHEELLKVHEDFKANAEASAATARYEHEQLQNAHNEVLQELDTARARLVEKEREFNETVRQLDEVKAQHSKVQAQIEQLHRFFAPQPVEPAQELPAPLGNVSNW